MLYRLKPDDTLAQRWFLSQPVLLGTHLDARDFTVAKVYEGPTEGLRIPVRRSGRPVLFNFGALDIPIVGDDVRKTLKEMTGDEIQWIQSQVEGAGTSFHIMNVLAAPNCIDEERTEGKKWPLTASRPDKAGQYRGIARLVLDEKKVGPFRIFRVGGWKIALVADDEVVAALSRIGGHGLAFEKVS